MSINTVQKSLMSKVPEVTLIFWVIKILATTVGETGADFLIFNLHYGLTATSLMMTVLLAVALFWQVYICKYIPSVYWLAVVMISIVGTLITDNLTDNFEVPLEVTTGVFSVALIAIFAIWYSKEKTLSIHSIYTLKRELFYWGAILVTFALGTAAGDLVAESLNLGYVVSAGIFAGIIAVIAVAHYVFKLNNVFAFWGAYILTRPFGASCGDYLSQPVENGGLGLGVISTSLVFLVIILVLVGFLSLRKTDAIKKK